MVVQLGRFVLALSLVIFNIPPMEMLSHSLIQRIEPLTLGYKINELWVY